MYTLSPIRARSKFRPFSDIEPLPPSPRTMRMSTVIGPLSVTILPEMRTAFAVPVTASASARTCEAVFDASPFDFAPDPQPASMTVATMIAAVARTRMVASLSHTIACVEARLIHHVGVAVVDLDEAVRTYQRLFGGRVEHRARVEDQGVEAASVRVGESRIELLAALGDDTPVGKFLAKRGPGMHHVAYEVDDVRTALRELAGSGAELIDAQPRPGMFGLEVAFVHPDSVHGVLTEVVSNG